MTRQTTERAEIVRSRLPARLRSGMPVVALLVLAVALLSALGGASAATRQAVVVPARLAAGWSFSPTSTTFDQVSVWNVYPGAQVSLTANRPGQPPQASASRTAPRSGFVDFTNIIRGQALPPGSTVTVHIDYRPRAAPAEQYVKDFVLTVRSGTDPAIGERCSTTTPTLHSDSCVLPCPPPSGISVDYCRGAGRVAHFRATFAPRRVPGRGVRLGRLSVQTRTPPSTIVIYCLRTPVRRAGTGCPFIVRIYPVVRRGVLRIAQFRHHILPPGTDVSLEIYKANYIGQVVRMNVDARSHLHIRHFCFYPAEGASRACPRRSRR
jgi:hypothetical protein